MINLMGLELSKHGRGKVQRAWRAMWIPCLIALLLCFLLVVIERPQVGQKLVDLTGGDITLAEMEELQQGLQDYLQNPVDVVVQLFSAVFIISFGVSYGSYLVEDIKNGNLLQSYLYPHPRQKIILAKILAPALLNYTAMTVCSLLFTALLPLWGYQMGPLLPTLVRLLLFPLCIACIGLIPLYFGVKRKSPATTIVASVLCMAILEGNIGSFSLSSIPWVSYSAGAVGLLLAALTVYDLQRYDGLV